MSDNSESDSGEETAPKRRGGPKGPKTRNNNFITDKPARNLAYDKMMTNLVKRAITISCKCGVDIFITGLPNRKLNPIDTDKTTKRGLDTNMFLYSNCKDIMPKFDKYIDGKFEAVVGGDDLFNKLKGSNKNVFRLSTVPVEGIPKRGRPPIMKPTAQPKKIIVNVKKPSQNKEQKYMDDDVDFLENGDFNLSDLNF